MKKRIIWFTIFLLVCCLCGIVLFNKDIFTAVKDWAATAPILKSVYAWAKENLMDIWLIVRYGEHGLVFIAIAAIILISLFTVKVNDVEPISDETMPTLEVSQKAYVTTRNQKPAIVVVEESKKGN